MSGTAHTENPCNYGIQGTTVLGKGGGEYIYSERTLLLANVAGALIPHIILSLKY
jgi:hypothetical protein